MDSGSKAGIQRAVLRLRANPQNEFQDRRQGQHTHPDIPGWQGHGGGEDALHKGLIYVAGRMKGIPDLNFTAFAMAAQKLRKQGYSVFNPAAANLEGMPLNRIMAYVLVQLCECQSIAMLPGWWRSGGARIEWLLAKYLGLKVIYL